MGKLTSWISSNNTLEPLFDVLGREIGATVADVINNGNNYTVRDMGLLKQELENLKGSFVLLSRFSTKKDSIKGEDVFPIVYGGSQKRVDVLTYCRQGQYRLTECKFGIRPGGSRPFTDAEEFKMRVSKKFDDDLGLIRRDSEMVWQVRIVVVEDGHFDGCLSAIRMLEQAYGSTPGCCSTDGDKHFYALCKCSSLRKLLDAQFAPKPVEGQIQYFCV